MSSSTQLRPFTHPLHPTVVAAQLISGEAKTLVTSPALASAGT
jgi:hypothetical protein